MRLISITLLFALLLFSGCTTSYKGNSSFETDYKHYTEVTEKREVVSTRKSRKIAKKSSYKRKKVTTLAKKSSIKKRKIAKVVKKKHFTNKKSRFTKVKKSKSKTKIAKVASKKSFKKEIIANKRAKKVVLKKRVKTIKRVATKQKKHKKRAIKLLATAYTSHKSQTDSTPFLAAWNNRIRPGMKIIAVSHDLIKKHGLKNGVRVKIKGLKGHYVVRDKMNKRFKKRIDIYMGLNKKKALKWGKRRVVLVVE
jgi:3D (Asp-Asp-Asp) domain-containing protein